MAEGTRVGNASGVRLEQTRFRRDRRTVFALVALLVCGLLAYTAAAAGTARELRRRGALERGENTARLCARLIDEQSASALSVLGALSRKDILADRLRGRAAPRFTGHLRDAVELVPDLLAAAVCDRDGRVRASYPPSIPFPATVAGERWFRHASRRNAEAIGDALRLADPARSEAFPIVVPVRPAPGAGAHAAGQPVLGYLVAYYRLGDLHDWLREVHLPGGAVYVVNGDGRVIAKSVPNGTGGAEAADNAFGPDSWLAPALAEARAGRHGAAFLDETSPDGAVVPAVIGYAQAERADWTLLVAQPVSAAFGPSEYLLQRLTGVLLPLLVVIPLSAWALLTLYHRQVRLARLLSERNQQLRHASQAKSDLLANVSHDLKTPIASMRLSLYGLLPDLAGDGAPPPAARSAADPAQVRECAAVMGDGLEQLAARVRNLLDMARLESGGADGADGVTEPRLMEPCDLADVAGAALERLRLRLRLRGRPVDARFPPEPLLVECDQAQMETVVVNLLENALNYSPAGSPLHLTGAVSGEWALLRVRDEGPGIAPDDRARVFEKFYRAANRYAKGGTGLGLAICRSVVEAHGGTIHVEEGAEGGAEFVVRLPCIAVAGDGEQDPDGALPEPGGREAAAR